MEKILLFGATGNLGKEIAKELKIRNYDFSVVVRNKAKAEELSSITSNPIIADITDPVALAGICKGYTVVVSALGKSVSPNDKSKPSFRDIDLIANSTILEEAKKSDVKKFVYVSALNSERYLHLEYFKVHHEFSEKLKASGINYSIIKPPAIFSAFKDVVSMARKGQLVNLGAGDKRTNPIYEGDLAKACVDAIKADNVTVEAGGKAVYTRRELNTIIQNAAAPGRKLRTVPVALFKFSLPLLKLFNRNMYDKFAFFVEVTLHDVLAPQIGERKFEEYIGQQVRK